MCELIKNEICGREYSDKKERRKDRRNWELEISDWSGLQNSGKFLFYKYKSKKKCKCMIYCNIWLIPPVGFF